MFFQLNLKEILPVFIVSVLLAFTITETLKADVDQSKNTELSGFITDASTGDALADAEVLIVETGESTKSDSEGYFSISELEAGTYTIDITLEGYENHTETVDVTEEGATLEVTLTPSEK